ncbi:lycopene beta-cyclase CrtY [Pseudomonas sp. Marseille-QA0892]
MSQRFDVILVGAGLANGLIALRLQEARPDLRLLLLEQGAAPCGNHTWSFHDADLTHAQHRWLDPLVHRRWPAYSVRFPKRTRRLESGYASILSEDLADYLQSRLGDRLRCNAVVTQLGPNHATLSTGETFEAGAVIDGRGTADSPNMALGYQAFLGQVVRTAEPHGLDVPIIMDATVTQGQGYRFVYVLPFSSDTLLIEDTHYVDDHGLAPDTLRTHIAEYANYQRWAIAEILREEQGVLPITLAGNQEAFWRESPGQPRAGLRAGLFHATTGYSLPSAVRLADHVAKLDAFDAASLHAAIRDHAETVWREQGFFRLLNRMLFMAGEPNNRWRVMQRFYGLSEGLIERFYAGRLTWRDKLRILSGKPPVPVGQAWAAINKTDPFQIRTST